MADELQDVQQNPQEVQQNPQEVQPNWCPPSPPPDGFMQKFRLYETQSKFYMVGRDINRAYWKVLKIDRLEPFELNIREDPTTYTERECSDILRRVHEGNVTTGGLKFVTCCYGIVGFIKFLGPYYLLLITKRRQIGTICGHNVYAISKSQIIPIPNPEVRSSMVNYKNETRYKKLLSMVDLTKDFFFSYSYHVMRSFQKNMCDNETGQISYETMFVWNEFLTRGIRNILQNSLWTVALVYGFFKQDTLSISGRKLNLTLIARRSRHYAGTRYLKRGVNENGSVANDVETEQMLVENVPEGMPMQISSVVQNRGSIPLYWSQETSRLNLKPDIILSRKDQTYEATRLHFENLANRYGSPIIILNLIKTIEKKPRESVLRNEFANAIEFINKDLSEENQLKFLHWDLNKHSRSKDTDVLQLLGKVAVYALTLTGFLHCQVPAVSSSEEHCEWPSFEILVRPRNVPTADVFVPRYFSIEDTKQNNDKNEGTNKLDRKFCGSRINRNNNFVRSQMQQKGVLRTNCIDCLDRTNVAQYAYGLAALGNQLHALGVTTSTKIDLDDPLAEELMDFYERMGDTLAHQYGGSAAHNKIFSARRGQWKAATESQEFFRTLQRYYSNAYMDAQKQDAINIFLGYYQPELGKPDVWEMGSDQHYSAIRNGLRNLDDNRRPPVKRSLSDGSILHENLSPTSTVNINKGFYNAGFFSKANGVNKMLSESTPEIPTCESALACARDNSIPTGVLFSAMLPMHGNKYLEHENGEGVDWSNFLDLDWLSTSGNSCEEESLERSTLSASPITVLSSEDVISEIVGETTSSTIECQSSSMETQYSQTDQCSVEPQNVKAVEGYSDIFMNWVSNGETLYH